MNYKEEIDRLRDEFSLLREVTFEFRERLPGESETSSIDRLCAALKFKELGPDWKIISRSFAAKHLAALFHQDMAYSVAIMPVESAKNLAEQALKLFDTDAKYYSNGPAQPGEFGGWPVAPATFDTGVAIVAQAHVGLIWFEDED